ncbi:hypothetical protein OJAV_G00235660 [Oryzias javanicus]|uniref:Uncharacterized protein n=1 Tax=Oryzias javanicus TaxID=123683 RepID=A0A437BYF1_ORYJA|nr:hypothetical protein OJAV_G00235660 [Oryzias javanicus]
MSLIALLFAETRELEKHNSPYITSRMTNQLSDWLPVEGGREHAAPGCVQPCSSFQSTLDASPEQSLLKMLFSCFKASDPNITSADVLFSPEYDNHNLWTSTGPVPLCSSVSPPAPPQCLVCFQESLRVFCSYLLQEIPKMEGNGKAINITSAACPAFKAAAAPADNQTWWIILLVVIVLFIIIIIFIVGICKGDQICRKFQRCREKIPIKTEEDADQSESSRDPFPL